jgi:hypothetical protein
MRFAIKSLSPPEPGGSGGPAPAPAPLAPRRPQIESVVWHPEESAQIAAAMSKAGRTSVSNNGGRVLYSRAAEEEKKAAAALAVQQQQRRQHQQLQLQHPSSSPTGKRRARPSPPPPPPPQQLQDVLALSFHFRGPPKPSTHPLPLGHMRIHWTSPQDPPPAGAAKGALTSSTGWVSCTDVPCPSVDVVAPDVAVHLQAPLEARCGEPFRLEWTLESLVPDRPLDLRVSVAEGGGGPAGGGVSSEEALVFAGTRESVVQLLPRRRLALAYRVAAVVTGPVALPRLVLTPLAPPAADTAGMAAAGVALSPPLRVSYRYVDNVMAAAQQQQQQQSLSTPSMSGAEQQQQQQQAAPPVPVDSRHLFVLPPMADSAGGRGASSH